MMRTPNHDATTATASEKLDKAIQAYVVVSVEKRVALVSCGVTRADHVPGVHDK